MPTATKVLAKPAVRSNVRKRSRDTSRERLLARLRREYTPAMRAATLRLNDALPAEKV